MSDIKVPGFKSSEVFETMKSGFDGQPEAEKKALLKKVNGVFVFQIKNSEGKEQLWTADLKNTGKVELGKTAPKPDITLVVNDNDFADLAAGKLNGQKAFMSGKLKLKGNMMLATKLDAVLAANKPKSKL